jgi:hypothetical protein
MFAIPITLIAVILGFLGMKPPKDGSPQKGKGMAVAGLVMGIIGTLIAAYWLYVYFTLRGKVMDGSFDKEFKTGFDKAMKEEMDKSKHEIEKDMKDTQPDHPAAPADPAPTGSAQ